MSTAWEMVVGLEVHVQLKTRTKAFCRCSTSFGDPPNTNTCPVCLALPGALPVLNERAVELAAIKIARTWSPLPLSTEYGRPLYQLAGMLYALPFDLLVIAALLRGHRPPGTGLPGMTKAFLLLPAIYFTVVHAMTVGSLRYRLPVEPPMAVLAAAGCQPLLTGWKNRFRRASSLENPAVPFQ